jgi:hypothetical protein
MLIMARSLFGIETTDVNEMAFFAAWTGAPFSGWRVVAGPIRGIARCLG